MSDQFKRVEAARADFSLRTAQGLAHSRKVAAAAHQTQHAPAAHKTSIANAQDAVRDAQYALNQK